VGRFSVDLMAQETIGSPVDINVKKREVAIHLHSELCIHVKFTQLILKSL
jgi:hypothetical protein